MHRSLALVIVAALCACKNDPPPAPAALAAPPRAAAPPAGAQGETVSGRIAEKIDASQYSYLRLTTASGDVWAAVLQTQRPVGADATVANAMWMQGFTSTTLKRTWDRIAFGTLVGEGPAAGPAPSAAQAPAVVPAQPAAPPPMAAPPQLAAAPGPGMFAREAAGANAPPPVGAAHTAAPVPAGLGAISVPKAAGARGRSIAEVFAQKTALKDKTVSVRGKVVKETDGVMGKNWLHLRDGTGDGPTADLAVASSDGAAVGDTVLVTGVVHLDRDLGSGYRYDVLVEEAKVQKE